jgi:integrase
MNAYRTPPLAHISGGAPALLEEAECLDGMSMGQLTLISLDSLHAFDPGEAPDHTPDHLGCPACLAANREIEGVRTHFARLPFPDAARRWMMLRAQSMSLKPSTHTSTLGYLNALNQFFEALCLSDITPGHIRAYQLARIHNSIRIRNEEKHPWHHPAGHSLVNHEISVLAQMLTHCRLWHRLQPFYFPLPVKNWSPRTILTEAEEERLFSAAAGHPEAELAYWVAVITNNTTASGMELRGLRLRHLLLPGEGIAEIYIPPDAVKNNSRPRKIALNAEARWAIEECVKRAIRLGATEPDHYLFPFRAKRNTFDPTRSATRSWLRKSWGRLRKVTGFPNIRPHDLRHHCITRLLENDVNPETVIAIAGHVSRKMLDYYAHQRTRVKYAAVVAIERKRA